MTLPNTTKKLVTKQSDIFFWTYTGYPGDFQSFSGKQMVHGGAATHTQCKLLSQFYIIIVIW